MLYQLWFTIYDTHWPSIGPTMGQSIVFDWNAGGGFPAQTSLQIEFRRSLRFDHTMNIRLCINNLGDLFIIIVQEQRNGPILPQCWPNGVAVGPALRQRWDTVSITKPGRYLCDVWLIKVTHQRAGDVIPDYLGNACYGDLSQLDLKTRPINSI